MARLPALTVNGDTPRKAATYDNTHPLGCVCFTCAVLVRPDPFQETHFKPSGRFDMERGRVIVFGKGDARTRRAGADDVAALIVAVAIEPGAPRTIEFGGPELMSRNEAITIAECLIGRPMKRQGVRRPILGWECTS